MEKISRSATSKSGKVEKAPRSDASHARDAKARNTKPAAAKNNRLRERKRSSPQGRSSGSSSKSQSASAMTVGPAAVPVLGAAAGPAPMANVSDVSNFSDNVGQATADVWAGLQNIAAGVKSLLGLGQEAPYPAEQSKLFPGGNIRAHSRPIPNEGGAPPPLPEKLPQEIQQDLAQLGISEEQLRSKWKHAHLIYFNGAKVIFDQGFSHYEVTPGLRITRWDGPPPGLALEKIFGQPKAASLVGGLAKAVSQSENQDGGLQDTFPSKGEGGSKLFGRPDPHLHGQGAPARASGPALSERK